MEVDKKSRRTGAAVAFTGYLCFALLMLTGTLGMTALLPAKIGFVGMIAGFLLTAVTIPLTVTGSKRLDSERPYRLLLAWAVGVNGLSTGCSAGAYFASKGTPLSMNDGLIGTVLFLLLCGAVSSLLSAGRGALIVKILMVLLGIGVPGITLLYFIQFERAFYAYLFFLSLVFLFALIVSYLSAQEPENRWLWLAVGSYGFYLLVTLAVLVLLSQGECCDGCDCDCGDCFDRHGKGRVNKLKK